MIRFASLVNPFSIWLWDYYIRTIKCLWLQGNNHHTKQHKRSNKKKEENFLYRTQYTRRKKNKIRLHYVKQYTISVFCYDIFMEICVFFSHSAKRQQKKSMSRKQFVGHFEALITNFVGTKWFILSETTDLNDIWIPI